MQSLINAVKSKGLEVAEYMTPVLRESKFKETGVLTPEEFVAAGDFLVHHCPTWQWSAGDASRTKPHLPPEKQFLITRNVPCYRRVAQMDCHDRSLEKVVDEADPDGGWVDTHYFAQEGGAAGGSSGGGASGVGGLADRVQDMSMDEAAAAPAGAAGRAEDAGGDDEDDDNEEAVDMEAFANSGMLEDDAVVMTAGGAEAGSGAAGAGSDSGACGDQSIVQTRTYDLHITYDKYYQTPRMWLVGYSEQGAPLSVDQMYADFSQDHAKKTVTMETQPHLTGPPMASVHPCRHAEVMKRLMVTVSEGGRELGVHQYLLIFLKFMQAVIPTIEYDYTRNFEL
uniref:Ubiquitin-like-conjugating enzyme ATG3 n=2 Tax=Macrostomum lignano TaxID=282301 RepID=A0A1I8GES2_9PLAT